MHPIRAPISSQLRPEPQSLVEAARVVLRAGPDRSGKADDASQLLDRARRHGIAPLLYRAVQSGQVPPLPTSLHAGLAREAEETGRRNLLLAAEAAKLIAALEAAGLPTISLKGPTLALVGYGELSLRRFIDLDLLFRTEDVARALDLLRERGYRPVQPPGQAWLRDLVRATDNTSLIHPRLGVQVEPHWRLLPRGFAPTLDMSGMWERRMAVQLGEAEVWTLGLEDLALYVALHGYAHRWERLEWLCDLACLIERYPALDWEVIHRRAEAGGVARALSTGLELTRRVLGVTAPDRSRTPMRSDRRVGRLAAVVEGYLWREPGLGEEPARTLRLIWFRARGHDRPIDALRYASAAIFAPKPHDLRGFRLPTGLGWLYYPFRLVRLGVRYARLAIAALLARE